MSIKRNQYFPKIKMSEKNRVIDKPYRTCPQDARYHNMNASKWCFATFVDHKKCERLLGEKSECCGQFQKIYRSICPNAWVERWEQQIKDGTFSVDLPDKKK